MSLLVMHTMLHFSPQLHMEHKIQETIGNIQYMQPSLMAVQTAKDIVHMVFKYMWPQSSDKADMYPEMCQL